MKLMRANNSEFGVLKISFKRWCICSKVVFATIDISSTIISFNSDRVNLNCVLFWSDILGAESPDSFGIDKAVCIVVPLILIAATPVGAIKATVGLSEFIVPYLKVLTAV